MVCRACKVDKDESEFKVGHRVCKSCRSRMDYKTYTRRLNDPAYKKYMQTLRKSEYKNNPWSIRLSDSVYKLTGQKKYSDLPVDTLHLLASKRLIGLVEKKMIKDRQASELYKQLKSIKYNRTKLMVTIKKIFNLPKVEGGLNAR